jgi:hypothetical protein
MSLSVGGCGYGTIGRNDGREEAKTGSIFVADNDSDT